MDSLFATLDKTTVSCLSFILIRCLISSGDNMFVDERWWQRTTRYSLTSWLDSDLDLDKDNTVVVLQILALRKVWILWDLVILLYGPYVVKFLYPHIYSRFHFPDLKWILVFIGPFFGFFKHFLRNLKFTIYTCQLVTYFIYLYKVAPVKSLVINYYAILGRFGGKYVRQRQNRSTTYIVN